MSVRMEETVTDDVDANLTETTKWNRMRRDWDSRSEMWAVSPFLVRDPECETDERHGSREKVGQRSGLGRSDRQGGHGVV